MVSSLDDLRKWILKNKLTAVGYMWGGGVVSSLAYQWTRPIPTQMKIIHARVYAQAFTLAALSSVAVLSIVEERAAEAEHNKNNGHIE